MGEFLARWCRACAACALLRNRAQRTRFGLCASEAVGNIGLAQTAQEVSTRIRGTWVAPPTARGETIGQGLASFYLILSDGILRQGEIIVTFVVCECCSRMLPSGKAVREIAATAKAGGQTDDITVVTVRRAGG